MGIFLFVFLISAISYTACYPITDPIDILAKIPIEHHTNKTQLQWGNENKCLKMITSPFEDFKILISLRIIVEM